MSIFLNDVVQTPRARVSWAARPGERRVIEASDVELVASLSARYGSGDAAFEARCAREATARTLERGEILAHAGQPVDGFYVIAEGLVRYFYTTKDGKERNKAFFREGQLIGSLSAYFTGGEMPFGIQALERCRLYHLSRATIAALRKDHERALEHVLDQVARELFVRNEQREAVLLTSTAAQRYAWTFEHERWIVERVPRYQLATYLGIDPVSLSRLGRRTGSKRS